MKLTAFARARPLLFSRTGLSNLLNKIQFTFEVVPCLILGLFRRLFHRCASILAQRYKGWVGGWVGGEQGQVGVGGWGGRWLKLPDEDTSHQSPLDGPDHPTRPKDTILVKGRIHDFKNDLKTHFLSL